MKYFLVVMLCMAALQYEIEAEAVLDDDMNKLMKSHYKYCSEKTKVDTSLVENARKGDFSDNPTFREYVYCMSQRIRFQDANGTLQYDIVKIEADRAFKDEAKADNLIKQCVKEYADPVEVAVNAFKCFYDKERLILV